MRLAHTPPTHIVQFGARQLATNAPMIVASTTATNEHVTVYTSNISHVMFLCAPRPRVLDGSVNQLLATIVV